MAIQPPFPFLSSLDGLFDKLAAGLPLPPWISGELQQRAVLFLNHVLQQEPAARDRLAAQQGRVVLIQWRAAALALAATPAGLLDRAAPGAAPDLTLTVTETSPLTLARGAVRGDKPPLRIEGDVQLAADVNWLVENVRWDVEEDLSRLIGDAPAHALGQAARRAAQVLRGFASKAGA